MRRGLSVAGSFGLLDGDVGGVADRAVGAERREKARDAIRIGGVARRADAAVDERQRLALHLTPLPAHAVPEAPVVIVIAGPARQIECRCRPTRIAPSSAPAITGTV